jgi:hypothetical protein
MASWLTSAVRHWRLSKLLRSQSAQVLFYQHNILDSVHGIVYDVLLGMPNPNACRVYTHIAFQGPVAGKLVDNYGPRWPILAGSFLHIFGLMMTSISKEYYQFFLAQAVCSAIGCSFLFYPSKSPQSLRLF